MSSSSSSVSTRSTSQFTSDFFDKSSQAWRANKRSVGQGYFHYKRNAFPSPRRSERLQTYEEAAAPAPLAAATVPRRSSRLAALDAKKPSPPASSPQVYVAPLGTRHSARIAAKYQ